MSADDLLACDLALHADEAGPEPPTPHDAKSHAKWSAWWLAWYAKPLRQPVRVDGDL
jgi:hypothetical protein